MNIFNDIYSYMFRFDNLEILKSKWIHYFFYMKSKNLYNINAFKFLSKDLKYMFASK